MIKSRVIGTFVCVTEQHYVSIFFTCLYCGYLSTLHTVTFDEDTNCNT